MLTLVIIEDHGVLRDSLAKVLRDQPNIDVVASVGTGHAGVAACAESQPDVVLLDYGLPDLDGLETARQIKTRSPQSKILVVSMNVNADVAKRMLAIGVSGYMLKSSGMEELLTAIHKVAAGRRFVSPQLVDVMLNGLGWLSEEPPESILTERELQVLTRIAEGMNTQEIARVLSISKSSVETYRARIKAKLELESTADMIRFAIRRHLVRL